MAENKNLVSQLLDSPEAENVKRLAEEAVTHSLQQIVEQQGQPTEGGGGGLQTSWCISIISVVIGRE